MASKTTRKPKGVQPPKVLESFLDKSKEWTDAANTCLKTEEAVREIDGPFAGLLLRLEWDTVARKLRHPPSPEMLRARNAAARQRWLDQSAALLATRDNVLRALTVCGPVRRFLNAVDNAANHGTPQNIEAAVNAWPGAQEHVQDEMLLATVSAGKDPQPESGGGAKGEAQPAKAGGRKKVGRRKIERAFGIGACIDAKNWRGVAMTLTDAGRITIAGPGVKKADHTLLELGLTKTTGRLFVFLAHGTGKYNAFDEAKYGSNPDLLKRHVSRLNKALCGAFGLQDNPVTCKDGSLSAAFCVDAECVLPSPGDEDGDTIRALFSDVRPQ